MTDDTDFDFVVVKRCSNKRIQTRYVLTSDSPYPIMTADEAFRFQKIHKIKKLQNTLMSEQSIKLQKEGWAFQNVVKVAHGDIAPQSNLNIEYITIPIDNEWGDKALFKRNLQHCVITTKKEIPKESTDESNANIFNILDGSE